jgi:excisionase family DNA binding protein
MARSSPPDAWTLTVEQAAAALGIGRSLAYEAVRRGEIPTLRIGKRLLVPRAALEQLLVGSTPVETDQTLPAVRMPSQRGATGR